jgi:hypothetical protein
MGEFEKARMEKALKSLSKENLCTILESTGLSVEDCLKQNIDKASHFVLLRKVSSRIDELSQEHWKGQMIR